jgi:8-oxo-dGTP diphosphatase
MATAPQDPLLRVVGAFIAKTEPSGTQMVLMARRRPRSAEDDPNGGLWEFPGGKVEAGEDDRSALARELLEELGTRAVVECCMGAAEDGRIRLHCYKARLLGEPVALEHDRIAWFPVQDLPALPMPPADVAIAAALTVGILAETG